MTSNQIKALDIKTRDKQFQSDLSEKKRSNRAQEAIGRTNAAANVAKAAFSPFKFKLNHFSWYAHSPEQIKSVANLPYVKTKGGVEISEESSFGLTTKGWMILKYVDTLPVLNSKVQDKNGPVNLLAQNLFSTLRSKVSGSLTFEAADYLMYIISVGSYYSFWSYLCRLYNILNTDMIDSLYLKQSIIEYLGFDYRDLLVNKVNLLTTINDFGSILANLAVPSELDYFKRKIWLSSNVFMDHKDPKYASFYVPVISHTYRYSDGILGAVPLGNTRPGQYSTAAELITIIKTIIDSMVTNESWIDMAGQTKRAFEGHYFTFPTLKLNDKLEFVYDEDVLRQIQGANIAPLPLTLTIHQVTDPESPDYGVIYQGSGSDGLSYDVTGANALSIHPCLLSYKGKPIDECILSNEDQVSVEDVVRQTRLKCIWNAVFATNKTRVTYSQVATELVHEIGVITNKRNVYTNEVSACIRFCAPFNSDMYATDKINLHENDGDINTVMNSVMLMSVLTQTFHFSPCIRWYHINYDDQAAEERYVCMPYVNDTVVYLNNSDLSNINRVAISSMFGVYDRLG